MDSAFVSTRWGRPEEEIYCYYINTMFGLDTAWWTEEQAASCGFLHPLSEMTSI